MNKKDNPEDIFHSRIDELIKDRPSSEANELRNEILDIVYSIYN
jgi:hypothetical protein